MKSQDLFIMLKLASLQQQEKRLVSGEGQGQALLIPASLYTARGLAEELGGGKSEVNNAIKRCIAIGLVNLDRKTKRPQVNLKVLREFITHGVKYVFPVRAAELTRGLPTSFAAPVLQGQLMTAGESVLVWPDAESSTKGQAVAPLFKSVPHAVKRDPLLYEYLALVDAIRLGSPREAGLAEKLLQERLG